MLPRRAKRLCQPDRLSDCLADCPLDKTPADRRWCLKARFWRPYGWFPPRTPSTGRQTTSLLASRSIPGRVLLVPFSVTDWVPLSVPDGLHSTILPQALRPPRRGCVDHHVAELQDGQQRRAVGAVAKGLDPKTPRSTNTRSTVRPCIWA